MIRGFGVSEMIYGQVKNTRRIISESLTVSDLGCEKSKLKLILSPALNVVEVTLLKFKYNLPLPAFFLHPKTSKQNADAVNTFANKFFIVQI